MVVCLLMALLLVLSLIHKTGFDLFDINAKHVQPKHCSLRCTFWFDFCGVNAMGGLAILSAFVIGNDTMVSLARWYGTWLGCAVVQVGRLKTVLLTCLTLMPKHCGSSDMNDALYRMYIIPLTFFFFFFGRERFFFFFFFFWVTGQLSIPIEQESFQRHRTNLRYAGTPT